MELRGRHEADGAFGPPGIGVQMRPLEGPTPRQLAAVYMYAMEACDRLPDDAMMLESGLPVPPEEMAAALNAVIAGAGEQLVWSPPRAEGEVPEEVRGAVSSFVEKLRARGMDVREGDVEVVRLDGQSSVIPHRSDGDPAPEHDGNERHHREERDRYLRLASTVYEGLRRIHDAIANEAADEDRVVLEAVRVMAGAITDGRLVAAVDAYLRDHGDDPGPSDAALRDQAERFARAILDRQIEDGEASVPWESRSGSRERRIATAELILRTDRVGAAVGQSVDSALWVEGVTGALMAEGGYSPATASRIARTAREVLRTRPDWYPRTVLSEAATAAEAASRR